MKKRKSSFGKKLVTIVCVFLFGYLVFNLVVCQVNTGTKRQELAAVQNSLEEQQTANEELNRELASGDKTIIERAARDELGYARPNERVFVDVSGK